MGAATTLDPTIESVRRAENIFANLFAQQNAYTDPNAGGVRPEWDDTLNYGLLADDWGQEGVQALITQIALALAEPGIGGELALIGPRGVKNLLRGWDTQTQYVPVDYLTGAKGNNLRRFPEEQAIFARGLMDDPGGVREPIRIVSSKDGDRYLIGEGNHRVAGISSLGGDGSPVPANVTRFTSPLEDLFIEPTPIEQAMARISGVPWRAGRAVESISPAMIPNRHGYIPNTMTPSDFGLPTYSADAVIDYAVTRARRLGLPEDDIADMVNLIQEFYPAATHGPSLDRIPGGR